LRRWRRGGIAGKPIPGKTGKSSLKIFVYNTTNCYAIERSKEAQVEISQIMVTA
jgi:hypothetical protein